MTLSQDERRAVVASRLEKAEKAYAEAKGIATLEYWDATANRLYYAAFYAVSALLVAHGEQPQTHSGVIHLFGMHFVKTGMLDASCGKLYHRLFSMRQTGDYDDTYGLTQEDVLPYVEPTGILIRDVGALAKKLIGEAPTIC